MPLMITTVGSFHYDLDLLQYVFRPIGSLKHCCLKDSCLKVLDTLIDLTHAHLCNLDSKIGLAACKGSYLSLLKHSCYQRPDMTTVSS